MRWFGVGGWFVFRHISIHRNGSRRFFRRLNSDSEDVKTAVPELDWWIKFRLLGGRNLYTNAVRGDFNVEETSQNRILDFFLELVWCIKFPAACSEFLLPVFVPLSFLRASKFFF